MRVSQQISGRISFQRLRVGYTVVIVHRNLWSSGLTVKFFENKGYYVEK